MEDRCLLEYIVESRFIYDLCMTTEMTMVFDSHFCSLLLPYGCLFSRVIYFRCFRGCIHDLRKLKKYQNFDPKNADSAMVKFRS